MGNATYPGAPARPRAKRDTNIEARLADGEIPTTLDEVKGDLEVFPTKAETYHGTTDVFEMRYSSCAGYADPLERAPEMVAEDVKNDLVSIEVARDIYGVVLTDSSRGPAIDEQSTERRREEIRQERLDGVEIPADSEEE